jgi:CBS domain-containing protein
MNEWKEIIKSNFDSIVPISLIYKGELISYGTGTVCTENGKILTACHVIEQIKDFENDLQNLELLTRIKDYGVINYKPLLAGITMSIPNVANDILIDIAILEPLQIIKTKNFMTPELDYNPLDYGESMLMAGFSEETPFVFDFDKILGKKIPSDKINQYKINLGFMKPPTFKAGILSHKANLFLRGNMNIVSEIYHIDNGMHSGSSGGPIINSQGKFVGIITHRSVIKIKVLVEKNLLKMDTPSGNTFGIGTSAVKCYENLIV